MLITQSLSFAYNENTHFEFPNIKLVAGENLLILGESGIGKTTLLHLIAGILKPKSGKVELQETVISELSSTQMDQFRGRNIGLVFQQPHFIQSLSLEENLELVQYFAKVPKDKTRINEVAESLGLKAKLKQKTHQYSSGEKQRAAIALAVINNPQLILADEPTANLDDKNCARVVDLLKQQASNSGAQLVIITHDQRLKDQFKNTLTL